MLKVFVSWSGPRSGEFAEAIADWLPRVLQPVQPWISKEIPSGTKWFDVIGGELADCRVGIICVTLENTDSPWLSFEAGALSRTFSDSRVCPILLGMEPGDLSGPLQQYQCTTLTGKDMLGLVFSLNELLGDEKVKQDILRDAFDKNWPRLAAIVKKLTATPIQDDPDAIKRVIRALAGRGLPKPFLGREAHFRSGFERHKLYDVLTSLAQRRLWIFGRKNRKLFDKDYRVFFGSLRSRIADETTRFDFRVLFLSPDPENRALQCAHRDQDFCDQLTKSIDHAISVMEHAGICAANCCRVYRLCRSTAIMIADDAVVYAPINFDKWGHAKAMTDCPFSVVSAGSPYGHELIDIFQSTWEDAERLNPPTQ